MRRISMCSLLGAILASGLLGGGCGPRRAGGSAAPVPKPAGPLELSDARDYVLALVNRDRAEEGLEPVERDEVAEKAAQRHVDDMTTRGFTAHWGTDGSVPEERYTEASGEHFVQENAACFFDAQDRPLDPNPRFDPALLEQIESAFMSETPPNDGHRKNIIKPVHNQLGIGLAKPVGIEQPCLAQEFVDAYGSYENIPREASVRQPLRIAGEVNEPVEFGGVGVGRIEPAKPKSASELNQTSSYQIPQPSKLYFPPGFKTPKPVTVSGRRFSIEVPLDVGGQSGRYEVSVWGRYPGGAKNELVMVSLRTLRVR